MPLSRRQFAAGATASALLLSNLKLKAFAKALEETGLKDVFQDDFRIGAALSSERFETKKDPILEPLVSREFNAITLENDMKWERVQPKENSWNWAIPDAFIEYGTQQNMYICGHVLVWHSQIPEWVFKNSKGKPASRKQLLERMEKHINTCVGRYKGRIDAWEVLNEAVDEDKGWRKSPWYQIIGEDYAEKAFRMAHNADPSAHLYYNDYNMHSPDKRAFLLDYLKKQKKRGTPIQGIGMQGHVGLSYPEIHQFEASLKAYAAAGMRIHISELEMDVLPAAWDFMGAEISTSFEYSDELNPYSKGLPADIEKQMNERYVQFFKLFLKYRESIERITFWGVADHESWKNDFPVKGRTNYPLLFDREYRRKPCYHAIKGLKKQAL
ncbi:endo-1,4-beta-xylanase [Alteromonadaceae bacterium Bs31]|nr:endo-1,4-beta-xylanase [Alteromonadaceae bacterium Bs31]